MELPVDVSTITLFLVALAGAAAVVGLARAGMGWGADFVIERGSNGLVKVRGRIPKAKIGTIRAFFERELGAMHRLTVRGRFGPGRTLRLRVAGKVSPGQQQRIRNFLVDYLR